MRPDKIRNQLEVGSLRETPLSADEVVNFWEKAISSSKDSRLAAISPDGAIQSAYTVTFNGCLAVLAYQGLRPGKTRGHREAAFFGVHGFAIPGLDELVADSTDIRSLRSASLYDPGMASEADKQDAIKWMLDVLPKMRAALVGWDETLDGRLAQP